MIVNFYKTLTFIMLFVVSHNQNSTTTPINGSNMSVDTNRLSNMATVPPVWLQQSASELDTFMSDRYNYFLTPGGNKVWICTMNLAWNSMKREILSNQNAVFKNTTTLMDKLVQNLNDQLFTRQQLSEDSYYASVGYGQEQVQKINFEMKEKFPQKIFLPLDYTLRDSDFISYAYLEKILKFNQPFSADTSFKFKNVSVDAFNATNSKQRNQLYFKYYNNHEDFLMGIETANPNEEILILKTNRTEIKNFRIQKVLKIIELYSLLPKQRIKRYDIFRMPVLSLDYQRTYSQMIGAEFNNTGFQDYRISAMHESLVFNLDRSGIKAFSQAVIVGVRTMVPMDQKMFVLNSDFWLVLKQKDKKPYLIMSVSSVKQTWVA